MGLVLRKKENDFLFFMAGAWKIVDSVHKILILYLSGNFILLAEQAIFLAKHEIKDKKFSFVLPDTTISK